MDYITKNKVQISYMDFRGLCVRWAREGSFDFQTSQQNQTLQQNLLESLKKAKKTYSDL